MGIDVSFKELTPERIQSINEKLRKNPDIQKAVSDYCELDSAKVEKAFVDYLNDKGWEIASLNELGKYLNSSL